MDRGNTPFDARYCRIESGARLCLAMSGMEDQATTSAAGGKALVSEQATLILDCSGRQMQAFPDSPRFEVGEETR